MRGAPRYFHPSLALFIILKAIARIICLGTVKKTLFAAVSSKS